MTQAIIKPLTLEEFLKREETKPASEFINNQIIQKPMPQGEHSLLQGELSERVNQVAKERKIALALPELRCTFGNQSIVPDVAVFSWARIPRTTSGRIANRFEIHPDWSIEILSPGQSLTGVLSKLLHCSNYGTELGWLINPGEENILVIHPQQRVQLLQGNEILPVLSGVELELKVEDIFAWLQI